MASRQRSRSSPQSGEARASQPRDYKAFACPRCNAPAFGGIMICPGVMLQDKHSADPSGASVTLHPCNCVAEKRHADWQKFAALVTEWLA